MVTYAMGCVATWPSKQERGRKKKEGGHSCFVFVFVFNRCFVLEKFFHVDVGVFYLYFLVIAL